jgi:hypothetical protein
MGFTKHLENNLDGFWDFYHGIKGGAGSGKASLFLLSIMQYFTLIR